MFLPESRVILNLGDTYYVIPKREALALFSGVLVFAALLLLALHFSTQKYLPRLKANPRILFLVDGAGALFSAFCIGFILTHWQAYIGLPYEVLYFLAGFPLGFALFDIYSYYRPSSKLSLHLKLIGSCNFLYCALSLGFLLYFYDDLGLWAWCYFLGEIALVSLLSLLEIRIAREL